jgi:hypothetical protein
VQKLWLSKSLLAQVRMQACAQGFVNSLDPRAKRFRVADKSLQQARQSLQGAVLALADLPRSRQSALQAALDTIKKADVAMQEAAALLDEARLSSED